MNEKIPDEKLSTFRENGGCFFLFSSIEKKLFFRYNLNKLYRKREVAYAQQHVQRM